MEEQADCSLVTDRKICPIMSRPGSSFRISCEKDRCAWWTGTECAVVAIAKPRGIDVLIKPPAVPGL